MLVPLVVLGRALLAFAFPALAAVALFALAFALLEAWAGGLSALPPRELPALAPLALPALAPLALGERSEPRTGVDETRTEVEAEGVGAAAGWAEAPPVKSKDPPSGPRSTPCSSEAKGYPEALATWTPGSVAVGSCLRESYAIH